MAGISLAKRLTPTTIRMFKLGPRMAKLAKDDVAKTATLVGRVASKIGALPKFRRMRNIKRGIGLAAIGSYAGLRYRNKHTQASSKVQ